MFQELRSAPQSRRAARRISAAILIVSLTTAPALQASQTAARGEAPSLSPLKIFVLQGDRVVHRPGSPAEANPVVEVRDENDFPVEGAEVRFRAPASGAGGVFAGKLDTAVTKTNAQGQATASFASNGVPGAFVIEVRATYRNRSEEAKLLQRNSASATDRIYEPRHGKASWLRSWKFWGAVAGGAAAAVAAGTRGSGGGATAASTPTITVTPGSPTVGGPR